MREQERREKENRTEEEKQTTDIVQALERLRTSAFAGRQLYDMIREGKGDSIEQEPLRVDEREWEQEQERYPERAGEDEAGGETRGA